MAQLYHVFVIVALYYGIQALKPKQEKIPKTFSFVSSCMQNVTDACSEKCAASDNQTHYSQCLDLEEVSMAYNLSIANFLACVGENKACLRLNLSINYGEDCWGKCSGAGYQSCLDKCQVSSAESEEAKLYLQCALQMNPAHAIFWKCLQQLEPNLGIEDPHVVSNNGTTAADV